jgi:hypothetical protein
MQQKTKLYLLHIKIIINEAGPMLMNLEMISSLTNNYEFHYKSH